MSFEHLATIAKQTEEGLCSPTRRDNSEEIAGYRGTAGPPNYPLPLVRSFLPVPLTAVGGARRRWTHFNSSLASLARRRQRQRARNVETSKGVVCGGGRKETSSSAPCRKSKCNEEVAAALAICLLSSDMHCAQLPE